MEQQGSALLSTAYFAPIRYFSKIISFADIYIEQHEHFIKQTYRNRAVVLGANGPIPLIVPVEKGRLKKIAIKDLRIAYDEEWQRNHWRTIFSAYNSSPFFEYYADGLEVFFKKKHPFLFDFNQQITEVILDMLKINTQPKLTTGFGLAPEGFIDFREQISPKTHKTDADPNFEAEPYTQVFSEKFGFVAELSIIDLLFNEGPSARSVLQASCR